MGTAPLTKSATNAVPRSGSTELAAAISRATVLPGTSGRVWSSSQAWKWFRRSRRPLYSPEPPPNRTGRQSPAASFTSSTMVTAASTKRFGSGPYGSSPCQSDIRARMRMSESTTDANLSTSCWVKTIPSGVSPRVLVALIRSSTERSTATPSTITVSPVFPGTR